LSGNIVESRTKVIRCILVDRLLEATDTVHRFELWVCYWLARLVGQYCFAGRRLSSSVTLPAGGRARRRARGRSGGRHFTAD